MNYFEQELRRLTKACDGIINPIFAGRACFGDLGGSNRAKLEFVTLGTYERYEAIKATVLNRSDGEVDSLLFRFKDIWGKKFNYSACSGIPHIWTYNGESEWYAYRPTDADLRLLAKSVNAYLDVFMEKTRTVEKSQSDKESVTKKIHEDKKSSAPKKVTKKKGEQEI